MTAYLIVYGRDPFDRFATYSYPTRAEAREASLRLVPSFPEDRRGGGCAYVIERAEDVTFGIERLPQVYQALTGAPAPAWTTRAEGVDALLAALNTHTSTFASAQGDPTEEHEMNDSMVLDREAEAEAEVIDQRSEDSPRAKGRLKHFRPDDIVVVIGQNPYREGTIRYQQFAKYRTGMTVADFLSEGGHTYDLKRARDSGHIKVVPRSE